MAFEEIKDRYRQKKPVIFYQKEVPSFPKLGDIWYKLSEDFPLTRVKVEILTYTGNGPIEGFEYIDNTKCEREKRPPLGIKPKQIWINERKRDLEDAIMRYLNESTVIPVEWVEELNEHNSPQIAHNLLGA